MNKENPRDSSQKDRTIRIFISSTFRDMQAEREELVKRIFPQLRKLCESRGVTFSEVDLRWGISDEQKAEGKVLPICLAEIQRCRPYFIGLLGERYGWVPDEIPKELVEQEPWLKDHQSHSVTELEILHGVLNNPEMADHSFFYFRDPEYTNRLPKGLNKKDFISEDEESKKKLSKLKDKIRQSSLPVRENYSDPRALGDLVLKDLTEVIERLFPEGSQPDPLDREALEHEIFAQTRARIYIGRKEYFETLDRHAKGENQPLVVLGESGSGKSALLANWALKYKNEHANELVIMHFIGASSASTDWASMLRRIMGEFKRHFDIKQDIPEIASALRPAFANWLNMAAAKGRVILIIDALNQLEDREGAPDLVWLPPLIPVNIRLILSALPGRALDELNKRKWQKLEVKPLDQEERRQLVRDYLSLYTKTLSSERTEIIVSASQSSNPLFLKALLEELRVFGIYERLDEKIRFYLESKNIPELYEKIFSRYEEDYEKERPGLVKDSLSLIWASRRGLSEAELLELLGEKGNPLPRIPWSSLFLAAEQALINRSGLIGFFHDYFKEAVATRYLADEKEKQKYHLRLADYFSTRDLGQRKIAELPWQLTQALSWQRLFKVLSDPSFFEMSWKVDQYDLKAYWAGVEQNSELKMVDGYQEVIQSPQKFEIYYSWDVGILLKDTGHFNEAAKLSDYHIELFGRTGDKVKLAASLGAQALIHFRRGNYDEAMKLHEKEENLCLKLGDKDGLATSLNNRALIHYQQGDLDGAMKLHKEAEGLYRELGDKDGYQRCLNNQALILYQHGDLEGALKLHKEKERICREMGNRDGLQLTFGNQANIHHASGDLEKAMSLHFEEEQICRELGNKEGLQRSLGNQAVILLEKGDQEKALALLKEKERLCRELENDHGLSSALGNQALIFQDRGDINEALRLYQEQERLCRKLYRPDGLASSLINQAVCLTEMKRMDEALKLAEEALNLAKKHGFCALIKKIQNAWEWIYSQLNR